MDTNESKPTIYDRNSSASRINCNFIYWHLHIHGDNKFHFRWSIITSSIAIPLYIPLFYFVHLNTQYQVQMTISPGCLNAIGVMKLS